MAEAGENIALEVFLAELDEADAAEARVAAARIDALERDVGPPGWIERNLMILLAAAIVLFVVGIGGLIGFFGWVRSVFGLGGVTLIVSAFPALMLVYLLSVRGRTRLDDEKMVLNERHFLPHGGIYFGAVPGPGRVVQAERPKKAEMNLRERTHAQHKAATKRQW